MRTLVVVFAAVGLFGAFSAPAIAAPPVPSVPQNCQEWNELLHIQNIRDCDGPII